MDNKYQNIIALAVSSFSNEILRDSSSGGVFFTISEHFINNLNGVVYASICSGADIHHKRITDLSDLKKAMKSKYVFSDLKKTFEECLADLNSGKDVFFVGLPCQISGLNHYLDEHKIDKNKLLTADLFCHGAPQAKYWKKYIDEMFPNQVIKSVDFRYKKPSWENYSIRIITNKRTYTKRIRSDFYMNCFLGDYTLLPSCYNCRFKGENRSSDFSIGDFWGINDCYPDYYNPKGTSLVIIRNKLDFIKNILERKCNVDNVEYGPSTFLNPAYASSAKKPDDYDEVVYSLETNGFKQTKLKNRPKFSNLKNTFKKIAKSFPKKQVKDFDDNTVGIITDYGYFNFGNRLQNYALRIALQKNGYKSINISHNVLERYHFLNLANNIVLFFKDHKEYGKIRKIYKTCIKSGENTVPFSYTSYGKKQISKFRRIVLGSDQIWNPNYNKVNLPFHLAFFGTDNPSQKIISYAASFGVETIPEPLIPLFKDCLKNIEHIGVRENSAVSIINNIGYEAHQVLDPVLLLDSEEWYQSIANYSSVKMPKQKYAFKYVLSSKESDEYQKAASSLPIVEIMNKNNKYYCSNHFDFLKLIKESELIITDSFHAFVFSAIFNKKVIVLNRKGMETRIKSLCNLLNIEYAIGKEIDFSTVDTNALQKYRNESLAFLINSLK